jgi:hypothetical protein
MENPKSGERLQIYTPLYKKTVQSSKLNYENQLVNDKKNPKRLFSYINEKKKVNTAVSAIKDSQGNTITDRNEIATLLNRHFQSVFVQQNADTDDQEPVTNNQIGALHINRDDVLNHLCELNPYKPQGCDMIHPYVLKSCANSWATPLTIIFRKSLESGTVPRVWLDANVTPIFKKGNTKDPANYRPISITSVPCKVMEKIVRMHLIDYLTQHNLLTKEQHGFVPGKSCITNLLESYDFSTKLLADGDWIDIVYLDFAKAFDKVHHASLELKLYNYGIRGKVLYWICAFLANRRQRVVLGKVVSNWMKVSSGVPQGSVLGSILFALFVNDLPCGLHSKTMMFADDTKLLARLKRSNFGVDTQELQLDIDKVLDWTKRWHMRLNLSKCKIMHIGRGNPSAHYTLMDLDNGKTSTIKSTESELDLGVLIRSDLKASDQVDKAAAKANQMLNLLRKTFLSRDADLWKKLYTTYIRPHLEYGVTQWCPYLKKDVNKIEKVQRRATKTPTTLCNLTYQERCKELNLTTLIERRTRGDLIQ